MKSIQEIELMKGLEKARQLADRVEEATRNVPEAERAPLIRSTTAMVTNMAMALDALRRGRTGGDATQS